MGISFCFDWENELIIFFQQYMSEITVKIFSAITEFGDAIILVGVIGMFYWAINKDLGKKLIIYLSFINIVNPSIKGIVQRSRPYLANPEIKCLKAVTTEGDINNVVAQEFSFPSGHAVNCATVYGTLAKNSRHKGWQILLIILCILVGISRIALGVHYPTDILAGWLIAFLCIILFNLLEKNLGKYKTFILLDIVGLAGFFFVKTNDFYTGYGMLLGSTTAIMFEEKYINFKGTKKPLPVIIRTVVGAGLFIVLDKLFKLPFSAEFLNSGMTCAFIVRAARYAITVFLLLGVYPISFRWSSSVSNKTRVNSKQ